MYSKDICLRDHFFPGPDHSLSKACQCHLLITFGKYVHVLKKFFFNLLSLFPAISLAQAPNLFPQGLLTSIPLVSLAPQGSVKWFFLKAQVRSCPLPAWKPLILPSQDKSQYPDLIYIVLYAVASAHPCQHPLPPPFFFPSLYSAPQRYSLAPSNSGHTQLLLFGAPSPLALFPSLPPSCPQTHAFTFTWSVFPWEVVFNLLRPGEMTFLCFL